MRTCAIIHPLHVELETAGLIEQIECIVTHPTSSGCEGVNCCDARKMGRCSYRDSSGGGGASNHKILSLEIISSGHLVEDVDSHYNGRSRR
jgi:hypothetical protein